MRQIEPLTRPSGRTVVTVGNFDGVHRGHQALLEAARRLAQDKDAEMVCLTFDPHPLEVLKGPIRDYLLTPTEAKLRYLNQYGTSWVAILPFTSELAQLSAERFLDDYLTQYLHAIGVVVGYNFTFGKGGEGTVETLRQWAGERVSVEVVPPVTLADGQVVSSSRIRRLLKQALLSESVQALGHPFAVQGKVVAGEGRGQTIGIPTANILPKVEQCMPPYGVYAGLMRSADGLMYPAVANWGVRPTFDGQVPVLEIHALELDQSVNLRGTIVDFEFNLKIRDETRFGSVDELIAQIHRDINTTRLYWRQKDATC